jgi:hypothetical protein
MGGAPSVPEEPERGLLHVDAVLLGVWVFEEVGRICGGHG